MEIVFLGTSSAWAIPLPNCNCPQCKSKDKKDKRFRSSLFIKPDILFDTPPEISIYLQKYKFMPKKIFITHTHSDHIFGLKDLFPFYKPLYKDLKIFCNELIFKEIKGIFPSLYKKYFRFNLPRDFNFFPVFHTKKIKTFGVLYKKIAYIPDTSGIPKKTIRNLKNLDLLIIDGTGEGKNHLKEEEIIKTIEILNPKKTILTHIGHWKISHKNLEEKFKGYAKIAYDGLQINI